MTKVQLVNTITSLAKEMESKLEKERPDMKDIIKYTLDGYYENPRNVERAELMKIASELQDIKDTVEKEDANTSKEREVTHDSKTAQDEKDNKKNTISEEEATKRILEVINEGDKKDQKTEQQGTNNKKPETSNKKTLNKGKTKKDNSTKKEDTSDKEMFPDILSLKIGKLKKRADLKDLASVRKEMEDNEDKVLVFATYWNKKQLRQYNYDPLGIMTKEEYPVSFEHDLDIMQPVFMSEKDLVAYAVSVYTDTMNAFLGEDFQQYENQRFCNGIEFEVYEVVEWNN